MATLTVLYSLILHSTVITSHQPIMLRNVYRSHGNKWQLR